MNAVTLLAVAFAKSAGRGDMVKRLLLGAADMPKMTIPKLPLGSPSLEPLNALRKSLVETVKTAPGQAKRMLDPFAETMLGPAAANAPSYVTAAREPYRDGIAGLIKQLRAGRGKTAASLTAGAAGLAALGSAGAAALAPKGHRAEGAMRGVGTTVGAVNGSLLGGAALGTAGHALSRLGKPFLHSPGKGATIGALMGLLGGGAAGAEGMQHLMGRPSWKSAGQRAPFQGRPEDATSLLQDGMAGKDLLEKLYARPDKQVGVNDVLDSKSMTLPFPAVKTLGAAGAGAVGGNMLMRLLSPEITPDMREAESAPIRRRRRIGSGIGAVLGAALANRKDIEGSTALQQLRAKLSI